jgi:hypothetical protein
MTCGFKIPGTRPQVYRANYVLLQDLQYVHMYHSIAMCVPATDISPESFLPNLDTETPEFDLGNISPTHILDIIKSFQNKSSLDIDGISLKLLKFIGPTICTPLAHIFNLSFVSGIFPTKLNLNRTVPIFKSGDPNSCDNYRPISLIPSFSKILEKIVTHCYPIPKYIFPEMH